MWKSLYYLIIVLILIKVVSHDKKGILILAGNLVTHPGRDRAVPTSRLTTANLNHVFTIQHFLPAFYSAQIQAVPWSDHAANVVCFTLTGGTPPQYLWMVNDHLLSSLEVFPEAELEVHQYFALNSGTVESHRVESPVTLWEAHKATMGGRLIEMATWRKRARNRRIVELYTMLDGLDKKLKVTFDRDTQSQFHSVKT